MRQSCLRADGYRILHKPWFLAGVFLTCLLCIFNNLSEFAANSWEGIKEMYSMDLLLNLTTDGGWFQALFYSIAAIPFTYSYCSDREHNYRDAMVFKMGVRKYAWSKVFYNSICSFFALFFGFFLFIGLGSLFLDMYHQSSRGLASSHLSGIYKVLVDGKFPFLFFVIRITLISCGGMLWSNVALLVSSFEQDRLIVYATPFVVGYLLQQLTVDFPSFLNFYSLIGGMPIFDGSLVLSALYSVGMLCLLSIVIGWMFVKSVERSVSN